MLDVSSQVSAISDLEGSMSGVNNGRHTDQDRRLCMRTCGMFFSS